MYDNILHQKLHTHGTLSNGILSTHNLYNSLKSVTYGSVALKKLGVELVATMTEKNLPSELDSDGMVWVDHTKSKYPLHLVIHKTLTIYDS
jgi:hypothetical protein